MKLGEECGTHVCSWIGSEFLFLCTDSKTVTCLGILMYLIDFWPWRLVDHLCSKVPGTSRSRPLLMMNTY